MKRGWKQIYLAELSGIGRSHISELENGRREAGLRVIESLASSLGVSLDELFRNI
jgi:transcriptional regulator with XRE-family HTH domain